VRLRFLYSPFPFIPDTYARLEGELGFDPQDDGPSIGDVLGFEGAVSDGFPGFIEAHDGGLIISGGSRARRRIDGSQNLR
jgi:hypothetical protein